jgi:hypothetical protein
MTTNLWPLQREADSFYGNPRGTNGHANQHWIEQNLVHVATPWALFYTGKPIKPQVMIHHKVAESLGRVFKAIWDAAAHSQAQIDAWGMSDFSGSFNYRAKRGSSTLSMHAYGAAIDFDADRNGFGDRTPHFAGAKPVLDAWAAESWVWGGTWSKPDGMHWQAARVR